ncbi:MAG: DUF2461 domain-containing protein [Gemmatimonadaceae bacterium]
MTIAPGFIGFRPQAIAFFRKLARNNRKDWFEAHRDEYEREVKRPLAELVEEVDARLATLAPEIVGDPRRSIFRLHRDIRFSKDKSPYKTHAACWFYHRDAGHGVGSGASHGGAGFYFHMEPGRTICGGGIWMPPRPALNKIRDAIAEDHEEFERVLRKPAFRRRFGDLDDEAMLTRMPRGFAPDHPAEKWLRYQSFTLGRSLSSGEIESADLPRILAKDFALMLPFVRWLNAAVGLRAQTRR